MHEDIKRFLDLNKEAVPASVRLVAVILARAMEWLIWVFVGVGVLLSNEYFWAWFIFVLIMFGAFALFFLYILLLIIQLDIKNREIISNQPQFSLSIRNAAINGIVGSAAFYLIIFLLLAILKGMGFIDQLLQSFI